MRLHFFNEYTISENANGAFIWFIEKEVRNEMYNMPVNNIFDALKSLNPTKHITVAVIEKTRNGRYLATSPKEWDGESDVTVLGKFKTLPGAKECVKLHLAKKY